MKPANAFAALIFVVGCSHEKPKTESVATVQPPPAEATAKPPTATATPIDASPHVGVSDDLAKQCALHFESPPAAPKFDLDQFVLLPADRAVLEQVATCLTSGPLRGRAVTLVGRADPRGTEEYNLGLGSRRAQTVRDYLQRLGVSPNQMSASTRGALDANGSDESGWQVDRRVDLKLG